MIPRQSYIGLGLVGYFGKIIQMLISKEKKRELYYISPKNISQLFFTIPTYSLYAVYL
jgi:hypothetical protein